MSVTLKNRSRTARSTEPITAAGAGGEIPLVAREHARKVELSDEESDTDVTRTAIEDDFAGRIYDSAVDGSDAVYVHAGGAYTTEIRDADDEVGAYRVNPDPQGAGTDDGGDGDSGGPSNAVNGLERALAAAVEAARRAEERAREGDGEGTERQLSNVLDRIARIEERLAAAREGLPPGLANATGKRVEQATRRVEQAQAGEKL